MVRTDKKLIAFDLDGTLAESKTTITTEMALALGRLLEHYQVAVISGGRYEQFQKQFLTGLKLTPEQLARLFLFPTNGSRFYRYQNNDWVEVYREDLSPETKEKINQAFAQVLVGDNFNLPTATYGEQLEDRGSQITFSALGQEAPVGEKAVWDPETKIRQQIKAQLDPLLPDLEVRIGGMTSIDVTNRGVDKRYAINKIISELGVTKEQILFIGDAVYPGGNDYGAVEAGVETKQISGPVETLELIKELL